MKPIDDVYAYALELATTQPTATAIGVAATVTADGPRAAASAVQIWNDDGEPITREVLLADPAIGPDDEARYLATPPEQGLNPLVRPWALRYLLALAGIRAVAVVRSGLAAELSLEDDR